MHNIPIRAHSSHIPTIFREKMQLFVTGDPKNDDFLVDFFGPKISYHRAIPYTGIINFLKIRPGIRVYMSHGAHSNLTGVMPKSQS